MVSYTATMLSSSPATLDPTNLNGTALTMMFTSGMGSS